MAARKRIPYAAGGMLNQIETDISAAIQTLMPLVKSKQVSPEDRIGLPAQAILRLRDTMGTVAEIRDLVEESPAEETAP